MQPQHAVSQCVHQCPNEGFEREPHRRQLYMIVLSRVLYV